MTVKPKLYGNSTLWLWVILIILSVAIHFLPQFNLSAADLKITKVSLDVGVYIVIGFLAVIYIQILQRPYQFAYLILKDNDLKTLIKTVAPFLLLAALVIPFHSTDLYGYINRGAQQVLFGLNPYLHPLADVPDWQNNPLFTAHWVDNPSPYGPFFNMLAAIIVWITGSQFWGAFLGFKLMSLTLIIGIGVLIYDLSKHLELEHPILRSLLFLVSPLMLLQNLANGHNDLWIPFGILGSWWLFLKPAFRWAALPVLALSVLVKFSSVLALPFLIIAFIKSKQWKPLLTGFVLCGIISLGFGLFYFQDIQHFPWGKLAGNAGIAQHSLNSMVSRLVFYTGKLVPAFDGLFLPVRQNLKPLLWGVFALTYGGVLWHYIGDTKTNDTKELIRQQLLPVADMLTLMVAVISAKFHPWYVAMFFPVLVLLPVKHWLFQFGLWLSVIQLIAFTPIRNIHVFNYALLTILPLYLAFKKPFYIQNQAEEA